MKTSTKTIFILLTVLFTSVLSFGTEKEKVDTMSSIEIDGKVLIQQTGESKPYKILLLCGNNVIDSTDIVDDESFLLKIKKNSWYTIRIIKEGYFPMNVSVNTNIPGSNTNEHSFHFDTELISTDESIADKEALDFPIAIITYNPKKRTFVPTIDYSVNIKSSLFNIREINAGYSKETETEETFAQAD